VKPTKKLLCLLACADALLTPLRASALDDLFRFVVLFVPSGPVSVGTMGCQFDADLGRGGCLYDCEWDNAAFPPLSAECFLDEAKTLGNFSCLTNSDVSFTTVLALDTSSPGGSCTGFDPFQQLREVSALSLGESSSGELSGTVQLTCAVPVVYSIDITTTPPKTKGKSAP
jgi:hypothetical protein